MRAGRTRRYLRGICCILERHHARRHAPVARHTCCIATEERSLIELKPLPRVYRIAPKSVERITRDEGTHVPIAELHREGENPRQQLTILRREVKADHLSVSHSLFPVAVFR